MQVLSHLYLVRRITRNENIRLCYYVIVAIMKNIISGFS